MPANYNIYYPARILNGQGVPGGAGKKKPGPFAWIREAYMASEDDILAIAGLDAMVYIRFFTTGNILSAFSCSPAYWMHMEISTDRFSTRWRKSRLPTLHHLLDPTFPFGTAGPSRSVVLNCSGLSFAEDLRGCILIGSRWRITIGCGVGVLLVLEILGFSALICLPLLIPLAVTSHDNADQYAASSNNTYSSIDNLSMSNIPVCACNSSLHHSPLLISPTITESFRESACTCPSISGKQLGQSPVGLVWVRLPKFSRSWIPSVMI